MRRSDILRALAGVLAALGLACDGGGGGGFADNGGMSGTGISEGSITAFGSIFVNGVEWHLDDASIEIDGENGDQADLRVGMVVRVEGDFESDHLSGTATTVVFDDSLEGPISDDPVVIDALGLRKQLQVLDLTVIVHADDTSFDDGASYAGLQKDQVIEVSGFTDETGAIRASRVALVGTFPDANEIERRGIVSNLVEDMSGGGVFDLGALTVYYTAATAFEDGEASALDDGDLVEVKGMLRVSGDEVDADRIEFEKPGLGVDDSDDVQLEGIVTQYVSDANFEVAGVPVDASGASLAPPDLVLANGVQVEIDGRLVGGVLIADEVEGEGDDDPDEALQRVLLDAAVSAVQANPKILTVLGLEVRVDGDTELRDTRDGTPNFRFGDIQPGDWLEIQAVPLGPAAQGGVRARRVERQVEEDDVVLQGPVSDLEPLVPALSVLGEPVAIDGLTEWFDEAGDPRSEEQFFRNPGDLQLDDVVRVTDENAADADALGVADTVEIVGEGG